MEVAALVEVVGMLLMHDLVVANNGRIQPCVK